jgi:hypothetical protein
MRLGRWAIWGAVGLIAAFPGATFSRNGDKAVSIEALRARCPTTRNLAPAAFAPPAREDPSRLDQRQQRIRGTLRADGPPPNAQVVLRAFAGASMTQSEPSETATTLWRLPDGSWHFVKADHYPQRMVAPPPPPARVTEEEVEAARHSLTGGALDREQARALDALLADPCLEAEPSIVTGTVSMRGGIPTMDPCYDAVPEAVEVVRAGRRRVYVQTCHHFLAGELIELALYPRAEGDPPLVPANRSLATLEGARRFADEMLRAAYGGSAWINATEAAGGYGFVHRASGFRCAGTEPYEALIFGPGPDDTAVDGARCVRNSSMPARSRVMETEWRVARRKAPSDAARRVRREAEGWFSSHYGSDAHPHIRMGSIKPGGVRMPRAEVAGEAHADAREDELTIVVGAEHDGWIVVSRATGSAAAPAAVEAAAIREWRRVVETRTAAPDRPSAR